MKILNRSVVKCAILTSNPWVKKNMKIVSPAVVKCAILISNLSAGTCEILNSNIQEGKFVMKISNPLVQISEMDIRSSSVANKSFR